MLKKVGQSLLEIREMCTSRQNCAGNVGLGPEREIGLDLEIQRERIYLIQRYRERESFKSRDLEKEIGTENGKYVS